jgi:hypothetical protein
MKIKEGNIALCYRLGVPEFVSLDDGAELDYGVLLRYRGMVDRDVRHLCYFRLLKQGVSIHVTRGGVMNNL